MLSKISGVGKKTAERIIIELKDKIGPGGALEAQSAQRALTVDEQKVNDAVLALMAAGLQAERSPRNDPRHTSRPRSDCQRRRIGPRQPSERRMMPRTTKNSSGVIVPHALSWQKRLAAFLLAGFIHLCIKTWRLRWQDLPTGLRPERPVIYALWHNRIPIGLASLSSARKCGATTRWPR